MAGELSKWFREPFERLLSIRDEMESMFNQMLEKFPETKKRLQPIIGVRPEIDVSETDNEVIVSCACPGLDKSKLKINLKNNILTIKGEKKEITETKSAHYIHREQRYGSFERSFTLPAPVISEKAKATYKDGILQIIIPKEKPSKGYEIQIESE